MTVNISYFFGPCVKFLNNIAKACARQFPLVVMAGLLSSCSYIPKGNRTHFSSRIVNSSAIEVIGNVKHSNLSMYDSIMVSLMTPSIVGVKRSQRALRVPRVQYGLASWYGDDFKNKPTATRAIFDPSAITAAHRTLPIPSVALVTNVSNGRKIFVIINDRGPFVDKGNRIIDLSRRAAQILGFHYSGLTAVRVEMVESLTRQIRGIYKHKDVVKSLIRRRVIGHYSPAIFVRVFQNDLARRKVAQVVNSFVLTGARSIFKNNAVFIGPVKYGSDAYMLYLTLRNMGVKCKIIIG